MKSTNPVIIKYALGLSIIFSLSNPLYVFAGLTDETQTAPTISGGHIAKSLSEQIGAGHGNKDTPYSSVYLIKRDPARSVRRGRQLFQRKFTREQGHGPRVSVHSKGDITNNRAFGAGLSDSCAGCHGRPRGAAGFGGDVVTRPDSRDAPHLFGLGIQEILADEITLDLRAIKSLAINKARDSNSPVTMKLISKGIGYGRITAFPDAGIDVSHIKGVDPDLRVRPFFAQGGTISMREFIVGAFKAEMGLESPDQILCAVTNPDNPVKMTSPSGFVFDPALDAFERPPVCDSTADGDNDRIVDEIDTALIDYLEFYLLNYFKPGQGEQSERTVESLELFNRIGCSACHKQNLLIEQDRRLADVETVFNPEQGIFNRLFATASVAVKTQHDGHRYPMYVAAKQGFLVKNIFTDFKRHDLGPRFHEREYDGSIVKEFMTEPLWGVASTSPYGHDGRSINLTEVILRHGGEAQASRDLFERLERDQKNLILEFLNTLILFPPDDTASNLNPGNPDTNNPQTPSEHGSINLGVLFAIPELGPE